VGAVFASVEIMTISKVYAVTSAKNLDKSQEWYSQLFGRSPDLHPMAEVHEWYFGNGGVQLVADPKRAGSSMLTLIVDNLESSRSTLQLRGLVIGSASSSDFATIAQITDPDGNTITLAQPGPAQTAV
jgi:predicted enzyme related to lactoylglutathione lyase